MTYEEILKQSALELLDWASKNFLVSLPEEVNSKDGLDEASRYLIKSAAYYTYLAQLLCYIKIKKRESKRLSTERAEYKEEYEALVDKENVINSIIGCIDQGYKAVSRAITTSSETRKEMYLNYEGHIKT